MISDQKQGNTRWHRLLGRLFRELLTPTGILVFTDVPVMGDPPEADILLLRKKQRRWTEEQRSCVPDGIRDSRATHILLEFKYSESVNRDALVQTVCYDYHYKNSHELGKHDVQTFLASSKTPRASTLRKFGWHPAEKPGVYSCENPLAETVTLILLNELADRPHNAWIRCFASRRRAKESAFGSLMDKGFFSSLSSPLQWFLEGLLQYLLAMGGEHMETEITPDDVMKIGKKLRLAVASNLPLKERLAIASNLPLKERLAVASNLPLKERLAGAELSDILSEFSQEEIEACLKILKKKRQKN